MYAISLSSIPPRFDRLGPVLESLLAQDPAPCDVFLCLPRVFRRFPGPVNVPPLPEGVHLLWAEEDFGPATKAIAPARHLVARGVTLVYCDDDWIMPQGWAATLLARLTTGRAATGAGFGVDRLGRVSDSNEPCDIAQGFSGVAVDPAWLCGPEINPPRAAWGADDIWLSGHLARQGIGVCEAPGARAGMCPAFDDVHALQDATIDGRDRRAANLACVDLLTARYGLWPPLDQPTGPAGAGGTGASCSTAKAARPM